MKRDMNNKERRKVVVRGKKKTYTRTMLVKTAQDIGRRESLHQIKLEQANHQPSTMSKLLAKAKSGIKGVLPNRNVGALHALHPGQEGHAGLVANFSGTSPYLVAHYTGAAKNFLAAEIRSTAGSQGYAESRRKLGREANLYGDGHDWDGPQFLVPQRTSRGTPLSPYVPATEDGELIHHNPANEIVRNLSRAFGGQVAHVSQNHKKWVR
jgi:hypothetical protein